MLNLHPEALSLSEFFVVILPDAFRPEPMDGREFWDLLSTPKKRWTLMLRFDIGIEEVLYRPGPPARFTLETGVPPILLMPLPHLTENPDELFDELAAWVPGLDRQPVAAHYRTLFDWLCQRFGRRLWVERSGSSLGWTEALVSRFPGARFIHMYRDGRDCAISMSRHNAFKLTTVSQQLFKRIGVDPFTSDDPPVVPPPPALRPFMPDTFDREKYERLEVPYERTGDAWSKMVLHGTEVLDRLPPERVAELRFETLAAHPERELRRIARFMGISEDEEWLARAGSLVEPRPPRWPGLPPAQLRRLIEACAPGMERLYGQSTEPVDVS
jgi:hypothetical protein